MKLYLARPEVKARKKAYLKNWNLKHPGYSTTASNAYNRRNKVGTVQTPDWTTGEMELLKHYHRIHQDDSFSMTNLALLLNRSELAVYLCGRKMRLFKKVRKRHVLSKPPKPLHLCSASWIKNSGRAIAKKLYKLGPCEGAGCEKQATDRHHKNGNTHDNDKSNVAILCRRCHMLADGRISVLKIYRRMPKKKELN